MAYNEIHADDCGTDVFRQGVARDLLSDEERHALIDALAQNPLAGDVMPGTGGFRKLRWKREGMGKRGGVRVIYYYYNDGWPLFLARLYAKNERENLTKAEQNALQAAANRLIETYGE